LAKSWPARYLDGKTTRPHPSRIRLLKKGLAIKPGRRKALLWPYAEIRQEQGHYEGEPVRLERGLELLSVQDEGFLPFLQKELPQAQASRFHDPSKRRDRTLFTLYAAVATILLALAFHYWMVPGLASFLAKKLPLSVEKNLSASTLEILAPESKRRMVPALQSVIKEITGRLTKGEDSPYEFDVVIVKNKMINAFSLPGGTIIVMSGLLEKTKSPEELAGVLSHEIQHTLHKDALRQILQSSQTGLLMSVVSGDASGLVFGAQAAAVASDLHFSRADESRADEDGMRAILRSGIDPQGMIKMYEMLKESEKLPAFIEYISDHPGIDARLSKLKELAEDSEVEPVPIKLPQGRTWRSLVEFE
jgi:predicted Zn-dependent protease